jgi:4-hydroxybenzoate polyprenyltransferase
VIRRWGRYVLAAYPPAFHVPFMALWAFGLTGLFAAASGAPGRPVGAGAFLTAGTLVLDMLLLRALDDFRDHDHDRRHHPERPLPSGVVGERDVLVLVATGIAVLLLLNAGRGAVLVILTGQLGYAVAVIAVDRRLGWPGERPVLHLAVNLPIQALLSLYVYAGFLRAAGRAPDAAGVLAVVAVTLAALCLELGRKTVRGTPPERTYVTVWGAPATSATALAAAGGATAIVLVLLRPWHGGAGAYGWGWLVVLPLVLPAVAAVRFAGGAHRWPPTPTRAYLPALFASLLVVGWLATGTPV